MEIVIAKLKQHQGSVMIHPALVLIIGVIFLAVIMESVRAYFTIDMLKDKTNEAVLSVAATNVSNVYAGVREGAGNARSVRSGDWSAVVTTEDVENSLVGTLTLTASADGLDRITPSNETAYRISNLNTSYVNTDGSNLNFKSTLTVTIPLNFLGLNINKDVEVNTTYDARF